MQIRQVHRTPLGACVAIVAIVATTSLGIAASGQNSGLQEEASYRAHEPVAAGSRVVLTEGLTDAGSKYQIYQQGSNQGTCLGLDIGGRGGAEACGVTAPPQGEVSTLTLENAVDDERMVFGLAPNGAEQVSVTLGSAASPRTVAIKQARGSSYRVFAVPVPRDMPRDIPISVIARDSAGNPLATNRKARFESAPAAPVGERGR